MRQIAPIILPQPVFMSGKCVLELAPIIEAYNCFSMANAISGPIVVAEYTDLPKAIMVFFEDRFGKKGRDLTKKMRQMLSMGPYSLFGEKITQNDGIRGLFDVAVTHVFEQAGGSPIAQFRYGLAYVGESVAEIDERMALGTDWLPGFVNRNVAEVKL